MPRYRTTQYFEHVRKRSDRVWIEDTWIESAIAILSAKNSRLMDVFAGGRKLLRLTIAICA